MQHLRLTPGSNNASRGTKRPPGTLRSGSPLGEEPIDRNGKEPRRRITDDTIVPLRNDAGAMRAVEVRTQQEDLHVLFDEYPKHFEAFHAIVEGRGDDVPDRLRRDLKEWHFLGESGAPNPLSAAVMNAAVRDVPDGMILVDPVRYETPEDAVAMERFDRERMQRIERNMLRRLRKAQANRNREQGDERNR